MPFSEPYHGAPYAGAVPPVFLIFGTSTPSHVTIDETLPVFSPLSTFPKTSRKNKVQKIIFGQNFSSEKKK